MSHSVAVSTLDFDSNIPGSNPGETKRRHGHNKFYLLVVCLETDKYQAK